jgi:hypothetical protein
VRRFKIQTKPENIRVSYKTLKDVTELGTTKFITINQLKKEFLITSLGVTDALRRGSVAPIGKVHKKDSKTKKNLQGKPELAYDPDQARQKVKAYLEREI